MAISTYNELRTAVANWMDRDDLTDRIPEFIALAEARLNRNLRLRAMETKQTANTVAGQKALALPGGYIQMRNVQLNHNGTKPLQYVTPEMMDRLHPTSRTGIPTDYTVLANEVQFGCTPDAAYQVEMLFYKKFDALSASVSSNWLLTNAPDVYLYGALLEAEPFIMNDPRTQLWLAAFNQAVSDMQSQDDRDRHSGSAMRVRNVYA